MKKMYVWMMAAILTICGAMTVSVSLVSCDKANAQEEDPDKVVATELIRTSKSWDGADLPNYPEGKPEIVAKKYVIPAGQKLGIHYHPVMNFGILVQGELTIISEEGKEYVVNEGEPVVEMVGTLHHGENRGTKTVVLYMFYLSYEGISDLAVAQ